MTKNVIITGVSTGIGYACAQMFIGEGYKVFGSVRKKEDGERLQSELGENYYPLVFDVTSKEEITQEFGRLKTLVSDGVVCLINNAGYAVTGPVEFLDVQEYRDQFEVNFFSIIEITKACLPLLKLAKKNGLNPRVINMSSIAAKNCMPFMTPYSASKAAVDSLTEGLRRELMVFGIDVVALNPGPIATPIWSKIEEFSTEVQNSEYGLPLKRLMKLVRKSEKQAVGVDRFARVVFNTFKVRNAKVSYVFTSGKWVRYYLPKYLLSTRKYDRLLAKVLKMI
ncbi:SDR family NAD(P)-dependent oxidoreductase [Reichenbachiella versicolor]|uniref:SDR family NAD(P)-dependent oxidoreductase n=1 Tax=Reichenbachiella versicolor TaxID=1821036 RepID=UPI000D6E7E68|nr:SDR family NAD(P)-dependent oxidoreductase [Reichenbachiella versicolor]